MTVPAPVPSSGKGATAGPDPTPTTTAAAGPGSVGSLSSAPVPARRSTDRPVSTSVLLAFAGCIALAIVGFVVLSLERVNPGPLGGLLAALGAVVVPALAALFKLDRVDAKVDAVAAATGDRLDERITSGAAGAITGLLDPKFFASNGELPATGNPPNQATGEGGA